jgi:hypothetical protein
MFDMIREGGFPMVIILVFGLVTVGAAVRFAVKPEERGIALVRALTAATVLASVAGLAAALAAVGHYVAQNDWATHPELPNIIFQGAAESLANPILGCFLAAVAWLGVAVGVGRMARA